MKELRKILRYCRFKLSTQVMGTIHQEYRHEMIDERL